jgi:hypothetical protein
MIELNHTQRVLLSHAAQALDGTLLPLPVTLATPRPTLNRLIRALLKAELVEEIEVIGNVDVWRQDNAARYGLRITTEGREIIAVALCPDTDLLNPPRAKSSKVSCVVALLQRDHGATLAELVAATGWLPHTTRAVLTGLRKKGHVLDKTKREGMTCYSIAAA